MAKQDVIILYAPQLGYTPSISGTDSNVISSVIELVKEMVEGAETRNPTYELPQKPKNQTPDEAPVLEINFHRLKNRDVEVGLRLRNYFLTHPEWILNTVFAIHEYEGKTTHQVWIFVRNSPDS